jgi:catechol 2,3-dioxygenase-like lactoylglutathione lyase family enzyme
MSRVQLALRVSDLEGSIDFYTKLFGAPPAKRRDGYANFAVEEPPLKLVLIEGAPDQPTVMDHLGVEVFTEQEVNDATARISKAGLATFPEDNTTCCYALQDKVWVHGPGTEPWEFYVVKADADRLSKDDNSTCCCGDANAAEVTPQAVAISANRMAGAGSCC